MPILIDGHNLIGKIPSLSLSQPDDEAQLVMILRRYANKKRGRRVVVIFDHGVYGHPDNLNGYGVECYFAKSPKDADRELIQRIRAIRRVDAWIVVSSDRAVVGSARAHGIRVQSSEAFANMLLKSRTHSDVHVGVEDKYKDRKLSRQEVNEWMKLFGVDEDEE